MTAPKKYVPQKTLQYVTFVKRGILESLQDAFNDHPDATIRDTRVALDFGHDRWKLPGVIIKFFERELPNAGVGHEEWMYELIGDDPTPQIVKHYHRRYKGDIEFEIFGKSSVDRDLVRDALIEVLAMQDVTSGGYEFVQRLYWALSKTPYGGWHYPVLNLDLITGYGENQTLAPWLPEDTLVYQASYRVPIIGEFYSKTPDAPPKIGVIEEVHVYPYTDADPLPADNPDAPYPEYPDQIPTNTNLLIPPVHGWYHFTGGGH